MSNVRTESYTKKKLYKIELKILNNATCHTRTLSFSFLTLSARVSHSNFSYVGIPDFGALKRNVTNRVAQKKEAHDATKTGFALWVTVYNDEPQERAGDSPLRYATFRITARETEMHVMSTSVRK